MSHITRFNLKLDNEVRLEKALRKIGCEITEGSFSDYYGHKMTSYQGRDVAFGFTFVGKGWGYGKEQTFNRAGFVRNEDGTLEMVGDVDGTGRAQRQIENAIENGYVDQSVEDILPQLESMGYIEDENQVELQYLNVC